MSFITPFLARKGDGGMVERPVGTDASATGRRFWGKALARACPEPVEGKGDRGMVERAVGHRHQRRRAEVLRQPTVGTTP